MKKERCPVCDSDRLAEVIRFDSIPTHCNLIYESKEDSLQTQRGEFSLVFCERCGHFFNSAFDPSLMEYTQQYENSLHFSPRFQDYAKKLVDYLVEKYNLRGKSIIDIGCGKGDFLKMVVAAGHNRGFGFDPSYEPGIDDGNYDIEFVLDFYSQKYSGYSAELITCRHVLEHISTPREFLKDIRESIGDDKESIVFFEVPNVLYTLKDMGIWDLIYEHFSYFSSLSLSHLFSEVGFDVHHVEEYYKGQFLGIEATPSINAQGTVSIQHHKIDYLMNLVSRFSHEYRKKYDFWDQKLSELSGNGKKTVIWGGGSKGITFLNVLKSAGNIEFIVDINPRKQNKFAAGSGQKFIPPEELVNYKPDALIVMNPIYEEEIKKELHTLDLNPELFIA